MKNFDFSLYIVTYNFIIGVLLMIGSEKIGAYAGYFTGAYREKVSRFSKIGVFTFGGCAAVVSLIAYVGGHLLRL
jgi:nickel-dependent lactate racemase